MKTIAYLGALIGITTVLFTAGIQATTSTVSDSSSNSVQAKNAPKHHSTGNWQTVLMENGKECKGMVFKSIEDAEQAALKIGCDGYHEHHKEDGTILYMPCNDDAAILDAKGVKAKILNALAKDEITQEQADKKLAWLKAKNLK